MSEWTIFSETMSKRYAVFVSGGDLAELRDMSTGKTIKSFRGETSHLNAERLMLDMELKELYQ